MNMRKIIAIMAAALMLCTAIPMSVFAAPGDVIIDKNFDDGSAFSQATNENGYMVFDATIDDWYNCFFYANAIKSGTLYEITFDAKANKDASLNVKINNNWTGDTFKWTTNVTTEWATYTCVINPDELAPLTSTALLMFTSNADKANGAIYHIDNVVVKEYQDPALIGKVINGDFSTTDGWKLGDGATIANGMLTLENVRAWSEAAMQTVPVKANTNYEITWKSQYVSGSGTTYLTLMDASFGNLQTTSGNIWMNGTSTDWIDHKVVLNTGDSEVIIFKATSADGNAKVINFDDITITEIKDPSFDGYIYNGDFETGKIQPWDNLWGSNNVEMVAGHNGDYAMKIVAGGAWTHVRQTGIAVEPNTDYVIKLSIKDAANYALLIKDGADTANVAQTGLNAGSEWTPVSFEFNSGNNSSILISFMSNNANDTVTVDDVKMYKKIPASNDGYIINGTFETGELTPWNNLWGSCPKAEIVEGGKDDNFALEIVSGLWKHVRQTNIAVEANTDYKITAWAKNASGMSLLVKDGGDSKDIVNAGVSAGEEWTEFTKVFNTGDYTTIIFSLMGNQEEAYGIFDNIKIERIGEHNYELTDGTFPTCETAGSATYTCECGASYTEELPAYHNGGMEYNPAKEAIDCANPGNIENYYCPGCNEYFADAYAQEIINPWYIQITVDCVKPEGLADCAGWTCETCGNENFGAGEHDVVVCQGGICSKCNAEIEGVGCQNYDTPACQDGVCYYCGGFVAGFGHENGATEPCVDGECAYGCGLQYPATEDHVDADADDYCDNCWNHLACIDEDANGFCDICWSEMPVVEIIYGDADGDGEISAMDSVLLSQYIAGWDVTLDEVAADADGDGEISAMDSVLLSQYIAGWEVVLGPQG